MSKVMDDSVDTSNAPEPVTFGKLVRHSALELILTFFMLFGVTSIVRWVIGRSLISRTFPEIKVELLIVGASVAILIAGLILSPPGRATGGHMNPARPSGSAILSGQTRFRGGYLLAPMVGAMIATWLRQSIQRHRYVLTHRLCGTNRDGSPLSG